jgi:small GTP-binding protein
MHFIAFGTFHYLRQLEHKQLQNIMDQISNALLVKVVLVGDTNVGKTTLTHHYDVKEFKEDIGKTIHVDFLFKKQDNGLLVTVWDIAGEEKQRGASIATLFLHSDVIVLVFDIGNKKSFENLERHVKVVREYAPSDVPFLLIGNKSDTKRAVETMTAATYAQEKLNNAPYIETSSKTGTNVSQMFDRAVKRALDHLNYKYKTEELPLLRRDSRPILPVTPSQPQDIEEKLQKTVTEATTAISGWFNRITTKLFE